MVRLTLHKDATSIYSCDVIQLSDKAIQFYQKIYPSVDVEHQLKVLAQLFRYSRLSRAETKEELDFKIRKWLEHPQSEDVFAKTFPKYVDIHTLDELWEGINGKYSSTM